MRKSIAFDVDWVTAKLTDKWVKYYNTIFNDDLKIEDIKDWNIVNYVKEEAKPYMMNILNLHKFYRDLPVCKNAEEVIAKLCEEYDVFFVTDPFTRMSYKSKHDWLLEHFPTVPRKNIVFTGNKSVINCDFLIDDGIHNLETFKGIGILYDAPYNREEDRWLRVYNWRDIERIFLADTEWMYDTEQRLVNLK